MATIYSVKPNVPRNAAIRMLRGAGVVGMIRHFWPGELRSVADAYIPLRIFRTEIRNADRSETLCFGIDAVEGSLDLIRFEGSSDLIELQTRNWVGPILTESQLKEPLTGKVRRLAYQRGFFSLSDLEIRAEALSFGIFLPYWVGFFGNDGSLKLRVIDAVVGELAGPKVHALIENWLQRREDSASSAASPEPPVADFSYEPSHSTLNPFQSRPSLDTVTWRVLAHHTVPDDDD